jgi:hypothetical protein
MKSIKDDALRQEAEITFKFELYDLEQEMEAAIISLDPLDEMRDERIKRIEAAVKLYNSLNFNKRRPSAESMLQNILMFFPEYEEEYGEPFSVFYNNRTLRNSQVVEALGFDILQRRLAEAL